MTAPATPPAPRRGILLSAAEHREHLAELERLRAAQAREVATRMREARTLVSADATEELNQMQLEQAAAAGRIAHLEQLLLDATVVDDVADLDTVQPGVIVELRHEDKGTVTTHRVTGAPNGPECLSTASPVGQAIVGRRAGDRVSVELPSGAQHELTIVRVTTAESPR